MIALCSLAAFAAPEIAVGVEQGVAPVVEVAGARLSGAIGLAPSVQLGGMFAVHPKDDSDRKVIPPEVVDADPLLARTRVIGRGEVFARLVPIRTERDGWTTDLGAHVGLGAVNTRDPAWYVQSDQAVLAEVQWQPATTLGVGGTLRRGQVGARLALLRSTWLEEIGDVRIVAGTTWASVDLIVTGRGR